MIEQLILFNLATFELFKQIIPDFNDLVVVIDMASDKVIEVSLEPSDDLSARDFETHKFSFWFKIVDSDKLVALFFGILDST